MTYAVLCWGGSSHAVEVFRVQRRCLRAMTGIGYRDCCRGKFIELGILTFPCLYILACLLHVRDHVHEYGQPLDNHCYNTRHRNNLLTKYTRTNRARDGVNYYGVKFFNALPGTVKTLGLAEFKRTIKNYLIGRAFYSCDEFVSSNFSDLRRGAGSVGSGTACGS